MTGFNNNRFLARMLTFFTLAGGPAIATGSPGAAPAHTPPPPWAELARDMLCAAHQRPESQ